MNDLKTVRDGIQQVIDMNRQEAKDRYGDENKAEGWACVVALRPLIATLDRMIETPAPQGCVDDQPKCTWDFYRSTLERFVYETTHLSAENADGSHDCKISKKCLLHGRIALELLGKLSATPTPAPTDPSEFKYDRSDYVVMPPIRKNEDGSLTDAPTEKVDLDDLVKEVVSKNNDVFLALHSDHIRWVVEYLANAGRLR